MTAGMGIVCVSVGMCYEVLATRKIWSGFHGYGYSLNDQVDLIVNQWKRRWMDRLIMQYFTWGGPNKLFLSVGGTRLLLN